MGDVGVTSTDIDLDSDEEWTIVWLQDEVTSPESRDWALRLTRYYTQGDSLVEAQDPEEIDIESDGEKLSAPAIACFSSGNYVVTWWQYDSSETEWNLYCQVFDKLDNQADTSLCAPFTVTQNSTPYMAGDGTQPRVDAIYSNTGDDRFVITWPGELYVNPVWITKMFFTVLEYSDS